MVRVVASRVITALALLLFSLNLTVLVLVHRTTEHRGHRTFRVAPQHRWSRIAGAPRTSQRTRAEEKKQAEKKNVEPPMPRPPLSSLVQGWNITGDVSGLLQFSIAGFPKTGTSTLMFQLRKHPEIHIFPHERCELSYNQQVRLIEDLYRQFPPAEGPRFVRGIKCPMELESTQLALRNYQKYFPKTDFIVGIRHPIRWFESFYNFRLQNQMPMPPAETLIGKCRKGWNNVCTHRANFHVFLANLGKTNLSNPDELALMDPDMRQALDPVPTPRRRVFLYEISQLSDPQGQFRKDLQHFLHLQEPIAPLVQFKPGRNRTTGESEPLNKMDICAERYRPLRQVLLHHALQASRWIRTYFLSAEGVMVSSRPHLEEVLRSWENDPCVST